MSITFPLFAFEKDDSSMFLLEDQSRILYHLEPVDIKNEEYFFWDANGNGVTVSVSDHKIDQISSFSHPMSISDAFRAFAKSVGIEVSLDGSPTEVWKRIESQIPQKQGLWKRFFSKKSTNRESA